MESGREQPDFTRCESPIERLLGEQLWTQLHPRCRLHIQKRIRPYRLDFAVTFNGETIGIECDGKHFHDFYEDQKRDIYILQHAGWRMIFRFRGGDIRHSTESCIALLKAFTPQFFDENAPPLQLKEMFDISDLMAHRLHRIVCRAPLSAADVQDQLQPGDAHRSAVDWIGATFDRKVVFVEFKTPGWVPPTGKMPPEPTVEELLDDLHSVMRAQGLA